MKNLKKHVIKGKNIQFRHVEIGDAEFIINLRTLNEAKNNFLTPIEKDLDKQKGWIRDYKLREEKKEEFYFIIESNANEKLGLVRMYDFKPNSFSWGSWLISPFAPKTTGIESALLIYEFAFFSLNFKKSHFQVIKENIKVNRFHQRFGAIKVGESETAYLYNINKDIYLNTRKRYERFLPVNKA